MEERDPIERLIESPETSVLERRLLAAWAAERPTAQARLQVLAALGLAGTTATGAMARRGLASAKAGKLLALLLAMGGASGGAYALHRHHRPGAPVLATGRVAAPPRVARAAVPPPTIAAPAPQSSVAAVPRAPAPIIRRTRDPVPLRSEGLADQIAAIDRARATLEGDPEAALGMVDAYETAYPSGELLQEADVLRIDALVRENDPSQAALRARTFLATYPTSPHAARVRSLASSDPVTR